jgi:hypothetical protein
MTIKYKAEVMLDEDDDIDELIKCKSKVNAVIFNKAIKDLEKKIKILKGLAKRK